MTQVQSTLVLPRWYLGKLILISGIYAGALSFFALVALRFQQIFVDFKVDVPPFTRAVIRISEFICDDYGWILVVPILSIVPALIARQFPAKRNRISDVVVVLLVLTTGVFVIALFSPIIIQPPVGLSGPSK